MRPLLQIQSYENHSGIFDCNNNDCFLLTLATIMLVCDSLCSG